MAIDKYDLLTTPETAERMGIAASTLRVAVSRGQAPASVKINGRRMFLREVVDAWIRDRDNPPEMQAVEQQLAAQLAAVQANTQ